MAFDPIARAVEEFFLTAFAAVRPGVKVARENQRLSPAPTPSEVWVRLTLLETDAGHPYLGAPRTVRDLAMVSVECFAPLHQTAGSPANASSVVRQLADDARAIFATDDGLRVTAGASIAIFSFDGASAPRIVHVGEVQDAGAWVKRLVLAPFFVDHAA